MRATPVDCGRSVLGAGNTSCTRFTRRGVRTALLRVATAFVSVSAALAACQIALPRVPATLFACCRHSFACRPHSVARRSHSTSVEQHSFQVAAGCDECGLHATRGERPSDECRPHARSVARTHASVGSMQRVSAARNECWQHAASVDSMLRVSARFSECDGTPQGTRTALPTC